jgi:hypothetical protein
MGRKSRRNNKDALQMKNLAKTMEAFGLGKQGEKPIEPKQSGPPKATSLRKHGDKKMASILGRALEKKGMIERATHNFHTYPARMHPDSVALILPHTSGIVHDPFCGGGTVLVEAKLAGRASSGSDVSPIAELVTGTRVSGPEIAPLLRRASRKIAAQAQLKTEVDVPEIVVKWYQEHVAQEIGRIRDAIPNYDPIVQPVLRAVLSSILIKVSYRKSDTSNIRETHQRPPGTTAILFHKKARELGRILDKMPSGVETKFTLGDARNIRPDEEVGLIITSPPYPGVYDYVPMHQLRYAWLDLNPEAGLSHEIGSRRSFRSKGRPEALKEWQDDTRKWILNQAKSLKKGGAMVIIVGDGLVGNKLVDALYPTTEAMKEAGLEIFARASADRPDHARLAIRIEHMVMGIKG